MAANIALAIWRDRIYFQLLFAIQLLFRRRIMASIRIKNGFLYFKQQRRRADKTQNTATSPMPSRYAAYTVKVRSASM
jgi:hypothetical protein